MSDNLEDVAYVTRRGEETSPEEKDLAHRFAERDFRQAQLDGLIANLEYVLEGFRDWAEWMRQADREELPLNADQAARRGAEARAEHAEFRLQCSVDTNIGRQQRIRRLRKRVGELEETLEAYRAKERN